MATKLFALTSLFRSVKRKEGLAAVYQWVAFPEVGSVRGTPGMIAISLVVGISYFVATKIGFAFTPPDRAISAFWPPNAFLLAALILTPRGIWWALLLAVLPAHLAAQFGNGVPHLTVLGWFIGNCSEALMGALFITHFVQPKHLFDNVKGVVLFLVFGVVLAPFLTSFLDAGVVLETGWGSHFWILWVRRLFSNVLADLTIVPIAVIAISRGHLWVRGRRRSRRIEAALLAIGISVISALAFGGHWKWNGNAPALVYAPLPLFLWAAIRFGLGGLSLSVLAVALFSIWNAMHGNGPFVFASSDQNILALKVFFSAVAPPLMLLSAFILGLQESKNKLIGAQEQERRRIGRELHDDVSQKLTLVQLELEEVCEMAEAPPLKERVLMLYDQVSDAAKATRDMSHGLHPAFLDRIGLAAALRRLAMQSAQGRTLKIDIIDEGLAVQLSANASLCLYRVAQEALQNVVKHSHAQHASVEVRANNRQVSLNVSDDGVGFHIERAKEGLGLISMQERVRSGGGVISIRSVPNEGTKIEVSLPFTET